MAGLVPAIHVFGHPKAWMPATSAGMTDVLRGAPKSQPHARSAVSMSAM